MGIRCSLLGHNYGDSDVEREREEQGSEVVVTIREEQTCSRCGKTKLVSENKEVTSLATREGDADSPGADDGTDADGAVDTDGAVADESEDALDEGDGRDAEIIDGGPDESVPAATREAASVTDTDGDASATDPETDPDDDAVILDETEEEPEPADREHGEWPAADDTRRDAGESPPPREWPDVEGDDEGYDAEPGDGEPADVEFGGGLTPETGGAESGGAEGDGRMVESAETGETASDTGFTSAGSAPTPVDSGASAEATEFVCPECGHTAAGVGSSLRAGDICPECRRGYIAER